MKAIGGIRDRIDRMVGQWRSGSESGQNSALLVLVMLSVVLFAISMDNYSIVPAVTFVIPLILGSQMLRIRQLRRLTLVVALFSVVTATHESVQNGLTGVRISSLVVLAFVIVLFLVEAQRRGTGLPTPLGEAMLAELSSRLQRQGRVPPLPVGWQVDTATRSAGGTAFSGDFMVARVSHDAAVLEMILVDVCGKGVAAGTQSLQLAGALGGLVGSLPPQGLLAAANDYLLRQDWEEGFATAVYVHVHLGTGRFEVLSAGHPPALRWAEAAGQWSVDAARGVALGLMARPEFSESRGTLSSGDALVFYTDGVVETRSRSVSDGLPWLTDRASEAIRGGFSGAAERLLDSIMAQDDDRAVLVLSRL